MSVFQPKDRDLFFKIAKDIKRYPDKYRPAGEWLNQYYDGYDESHWRKRKDELVLCIKSRQLNGKLKCLSDKIEFALSNCPESVITLRLAFALEDLMEEYEGAGVMDDNCARALLIITWLATDPEANKTNLNLTKFANLPWKTKNLMSKGYSISEPSRFGLAPFLFIVLDLTLHHDYEMVGEPAYELNLTYLPAVRSAWAKVQAKKEYRAKTETEQDIKPVKEILLESIRRAYEDFERLVETDENLDKLSFEETSYAEAVVIDYLMEKFGEQDDALGNWPRDWHECPEAFHLYKAKIREFRASQAKESLDEVKRIAEVQPDSDTKTIEESPQLNDTERYIVEALGTKTLIGEELAKKAGYPYNSNFKSTLSSLRKRDILGNKSPGYFIEPKYHFLISKSD